MSTPGELAGEQIEASEGPRLVSHHVLIALYGVIGAFLPLAVFAVVCRGLALYTKRSYGRWDDWTMVCCLLTTAALAGMSIVQARAGYTGPGDRTPLAWLEHVLLLTWAIQILTIVSFYVVKLSLCFRYLHIVDGLRDTFWKSTLASIGLLTAHFISSSLVWLFQCWPVGSFWTVTNPGRCINQQAWILFNAVQLATDVLVILLPVRTVWKLTLPLKTRLAVLFIFLVGGVSTVAGIMRFYYSYRFFEGSTDPGDVTVRIQIWSLIEICLAIICGCMPAFKTLLASMRGELRQSSTRNTTNNSTQNTNSTGTSCSTKRSLFPCGKKEQQGTFDAYAFDGSADIDTMDQQNSASPHSALESPPAMRQSPSRPWVRSELATRITV